MIVVLGSINLDLFFAAPHLPRAGETVLCEAAEASPGGKGANQALAARRDGAAVCMVGAVGRDAFAEPALALLRAAGVDLSAVAHADRPTGLAAVTVDPAGGNQIMVASGANLAVRAEQIAEGWLAPTATLVLQMEIPPAETALAIDRAHALGARVVLNLAPAGTLPEAALRQVDFLIGNEIEIASLAPGAPAEAAVVLGNRLGIGVVVTCGADGAAMATPEGLWQIGALPITAVDTTGAGDTFVGAFAASLDRGLTPPEALRRASVAAGLACTGRGAQTALPERRRIDREIPRLAPATRLPRRG